MKIQKVENFYLNSQIPGIKVKIFTKKIHFFLRKHPNTYLVDTKKKTAEKKKSLKLLKSKVCALFIAIVIMDGEYIYCICELTMLTMFFFVMSK